MSSGESCLQEVSSLEHDPTPSPNPNPNPNSHLDPSPNPHQVSGLEQDLACGEDAQQKPLKTAMADLRSLLGRSDLPLSPEDRLRLLMMYVISQARDHSARIGSLPCVCCC